MLRDGEHAIGRAAGPDDEVALVAQRQVQVVGVLAVDDGDEDGVVRRGRARPVRARAQHEPERVGGLVPGAAALGGVGLGGREVGDAGQLKGVGQVGSREAVADHFGEGAAFEGRLRGGDVIVDEGFARLGVKEHPVLLDRRTRRGWVAG